MVKRASLIEFVPDIELRLCSPEDLIVLKSFAARAQDWQDVASVIVRQGVENLDWHYIFFNLQPLCTLKEDPGIIERLQEMRRGG